jgi:LysM repeat protein
MLRRILIIVLVAVVIIAGIFAIRWYLNQDSGQAEQPEGEDVAVVDDGEATTGDETMEEGVVDEAPLIDETAPTDQTEASVGGEESKESYPAPAEGGEAAPAEGGEAAPAEGGEAAPGEGSGDESMGGVAESGDANVGGGVPAEGGEAATESGDAGVAESAEGTGGIDDVAAVSPVVAFNVQPGVPTQHEVENLEWLTQLARCYGTTVADIQAANNYSCPDLIHPGWVVNISNPGNAGPITINEMDCFLYHTVQQGETLYSIANHYGINYQWLARINAVYNYDYIYAGQQLVIPNPVDPVFTQPPAQQFYYSNCWYNYCPGWQYPVYAVPYGN